MLDPSHAHSPNVEFGSPMKMLELAGRVFLDALLYYQKEARWVLENLEPFHSIAAGRLDRISPGSKHFVGSGFWQNCLSQCCVRRVSLTVPKHLDSCSTSIRPSWLQGLSPHTLFLGSKGMILVLWDRAPHQAPLLKACFFLSQSLCLCSVSRCLTLSLSNK